MVANILRSDSEKRDFSIVLVYLIITHSLSNVKFENVLPLRASEVERAADEIAIAEMNADAEMAGKTDVLRADQNEFVAQPGTIMHWLTSFQFFQPTGGNDMFAYLQQGERNNGIDPRDDFNLALLNPLPLAPVEPRQTETDDEMFALEAALRNVEGVSLNDAEEDFATGLSLTRANQTDMPQTTYEYGSFNSFDAFMNQISTQDLPVFGGPQPNCVCIDGKPTLVVDNSFRFDQWWSSEDSELVNKGDAFLSACAAQSPCTSDSFMNASTSSQDTPTLLPVPAFEHLLAEVGSSNDLDYEGLKQFAYVTNQTTAADSKAVLAAEAEDDVKVTNESRDRHVMNWLNQPSAATNGDHDYTAIDGEPQFMTLLEDVPTPQQELNLVAMMGYVEPFTQQAQTSDDESGVHTDEMLDYDPDQNAFGGYRTPQLRPEATPIYSDHLSDDDYMRAQFGRATMQAAALSPVDEFTELDDCMLDEVDDEAMREMVDTYTLPKSSERQRASSSRRKREASEDTAESSWDADDDSFSQSNSQTQFSVNAFTGNLPYSDGEIVHSTWSHFETILRDRRLTPVDVQLMKDVRRRGKNKIAAMNCRRRKQNRVESLRDERSEIAHENDALEARLARLREEERVYDARLERALRSLRENGYGDRQIDTRS